MKSIFLSVLLVLGSVAITQQAKSQNVKDIRELTIGDTCPDFVFSNILNSDKSTFRLSDQKGKLVILDFWATWCTPCISGLLTMDSLQRQFGDKVSIIPVTPEKMSVVKNFLAVSKTLKNKLIMTVTGDTILRKYFNYQSIPHEVWINEKGVVVAITGADKVTAINIQKALDRSNISLKKKKDVLGRPYLTKPLLMGGLGAEYPEDEIKPKFSSIITGKIEGMPSVTLGSHFIGNSTRVLSVNASIDGLYKTLYGSSAIGKSISYYNKSMFLRFPSRVIWEARDSILYNWPGRERKSWKAVPDSVRLFSYEIIIPKKDSLFLGTYMEQDLNRYFGNLYGIEGLKETRIVKCWVLVRTTKDDLIRSQGGKEQIIIDENQDTLLIRNSTISRFLLYWMSFQSNIFRMTTPIIDGTGYIEPVDINIHVNPNDFNAVNAALKKYGLEFRLENREMEMIVIRDKS